MAWRGLSLVQQNRTTSPHADSSKEFSLLPKSRLIEYLMAFSMTMDALSLLELHQLTNMLNPQERLCINTTLHIKRRITICGVVFE